VLARAALFVGNDSGVSHLAGAVGAAGVVLFGPSDPRRWRPAAGRLVSLRARASAPDGIPLAALSAARVIAACRRRFALTRGDPVTSVGAYGLTGRSRRTLK
jgi:ADP-heptose:LPS heptosyltransferase